VLHLEAVPDTELGVYVFKVSLDGVLADEQARRDFATRQLFDGQQSYFTLS